jgi:predicted DNA-binding transcriptional regulator YafY
MPINRDAFLRYRVLDKCLRNPIKRYCIEDLIEVCNEELSFKDKGISRRTIYYDIEYMKSSDGWEAPIVSEREGHNVYYHYSDPDFSIEKMSLSEAQMKQMEAAINLLNSVEGLPQFEGLQDSFAKLGLVSLNAKAKPCFGLEHNEFVEGLSYLTPLFNAIQYEVALKISYKPFYSDAMDFVFHPQFLKQYNNRWFVFGVKESHKNKIWNLPLDRIQNIEAKKEYPYIKLEIDWNDYFYDIIGVTNLENAPVESIHFLAHGKTACYIYTKPLHGSQVSKWLDEKTLDITLNVKINKELKRKLLSYAPNITILGPQSLVDDHKNALKKALEQYQ